MLKQINIGIIGLGTIGTGVVEILKENSLLLQKRTGIKINLKKVCDLSLKTPKKLGISDIATKDYHNIIDDKDIDVVLELIGGYEPARTIIKKAIKAGKHVITANKAVLAKYDDEIFSLALQNKVNILFEAAVGGCMPIIKTIEESFSSDKIIKIYGILNGTTNYMLTRMSEGMDYEEALKKAQDLGFAEADPTFDVDGFDASQKISILASLAFDIKIEKPPFVSGIRDIDSRDMKYARQLGYTIKLLAIAKKNNGNVEIRTHPTMLPLTHPFANINEEVNSVQLTGKNVGNIYLSGKGAGKKPTATVVVTDILDLASRGKVTYRKFHKLNTKKMQDITSKYYLRFNVVEKPGVLAQITKILGKNDVSISAFWQKETNKKTVPIVILTHQALEKNVIKALKRCNKLNIVKKKATLIRIENPE